MAKLDAGLKRENACGKGGKGKLLVCIGVSAGELREGMLIN
jgi:hypothetical protein